MNETGKRQTFWQLIMDDINIKIPIIQRDYIQGRETPQVKFARENLLSDMATSLKTAKPIDLNFIYGNTEKNYFIPIDGQQRLTTLFLIHAYAFAKDNLIDKLQILKNSFIYETRITTDRFFKALVDNLPAFFKEKSYSNLKSYIYDAAWFSNNWDEDPSIYSAIVVLNEINEKFVDIDELSHKLIKEDCPISFMALKISDMGKANELYIKMNSRGKILSYFESFKSEFFELIDKKDNDKWPNFKQNIDNKWQNLIWSACKNNNIDPFKKCDNIFMDLIHYIIYNRVVPSRDSYDFIKVNNMINNGGFFNYANYECFLNDTNINDIYQLFEFLSFLKDNAEAFYNQTIKWLLMAIEKPEWSEKVLLFAITKYATTEKNWCIESFQAYFRIINNLIQNSIIDKEKLYIDACNSINNFNDLVFNDAENFFIKNDENQISSVNFFFERDQLKEERFKCLLIKIDYNWKEVIVNAEQNKYFTGEIAFALKLAGADLNVFSSAEKMHISDFNLVWETVSILFGDNGLKVDDNLFSRALLTFGDYSILANSSYTFFFEGGKGYFNWRRMLRENKSFEIFKKFFNVVKVAIKDGENLNDYLEKIINNYDDEDNELIYYLIKYPEIFKYMSEKRYLKCNDDIEKHRIILYSRARLSAEYAELHTYVLKVIFSDKIEYIYGHGYLHYDDSVAHISKINNKNNYIEYDGKFIDENKKVLINDGKEVITIKDAIEYVIKLIK